MQITDLVATINAKLDGERLPLAKLCLFVDSAIDDINTRLNTKFPTLSETVNGTSLTNPSDAYTAIPDKYIRTVIAPGAAFKYYTTDEEGLGVAPKYEEEFSAGLFYMLRDYLPLVPLEYMEDMTQGHIAMETEGGLDFDHGCFSL